MNRLGMDSNLLLVITFVLGVCSLAFLTGCYFTQGCGQRVPHRRRLPRNRIKHNLPTHDLDDDDNEELGLRASPARDVEARLSAAEEMLTAMRAEQEQTRAVMAAQLEAERTARAKHAASMSRLLDELCEVLQQELATEKSRRRDALAEVRASISSLEQKSQPATFVQL